MSFSSRHIFVIVFSHIILTRIPILEDVSNNTKTIRTTVPNLMICFAFHRVNVKLHTSCALNDNL